MNWLRALRAKGKQTALTNADDFFFMMLTMFVVGILVHTLYIHVLILGFTWYALAYAVVIVIGIYMARKEYLKVWRSRV